MPFKSKSQLGLCFSKQFSSHGSSSWDCEKWLKETPNATCLHHRLASSESGRPSVGRSLTTFESKVEGCRKLSPKDKKVSGVHFGARGGAYVVAGGVKVYIPRGNKDGVDNIDWVISKYGRA